MTLLDRVSTLLDGHGIRHALIGAAALAAAGVARSTYDIDLLAVDRRVLDARLWNELRESGVSVDVRHGDEDDPLAGVVRVESGRERPVDVIVAKQGWQADVIGRARKVGASVPIVTPADLILLKLYAGGAQDAWDIRELLKASEAGAWAGTVDLALRELPEPMRRLWADLRTEAR